jgi:cobalamin biosynthesis Co2+ chelatase CbiK
MSTKLKIIERIKARLDAEISNNNPLKYLKKFEPSEYYDVLISTLITTQEHL